MSINVLNLYLLNIIPKQKTCKDNLNYLFSETILVVFYKIIWTI